MWIKYLLVALGGALGSVLRAGIANLMIRLLGISTFPLGTALVNLAGCFMIGIVSCYLQAKHPQHPYFAPLFITGFLGGMTTFSSYGLESYVLLQNNFFWYGLLNIAGQVVLGLLAVALGFKLTQGCLL